MYPVGYKAMIHFSQKTLKVSDELIFNGGSVKPDRITRLSWEKSNHESIQGWTHTSKNTRHWQITEELSVFTPSTSSKVWMDTLMQSNVAGINIQLSLCTFFLNKCKLKPKIWCWWRQKHYEWWEKVAANADKTNTLNIHPLLTYWSSNIELFVISALKNLVY